MRASTMRIGLFAALCVATAVGTAAGAPILSGTASISFSGDFGDGPGSVSESDVVSVGAGPEMAFGDGSDIGTNVLLDLESLDLEGLTITYTIQGGSNVDAVEAGYGDNGMLAGRFIFSGLHFTPGATIVGISTALTDVLDPENVLGDFSFTGSSLTMPGLEKLLILVSPGNIGTVAVTLQVRETGPPPAPEPATLAMLALAVTSLGGRRWWVRKRTDE